MTPTNIIAFWRRDADETWKTAQILFAAKRYDHALFFCHLAIEKLLKGLVYKQTGNPPPKIHKLVLLATQAKIHLSDTQRNNLAEITGWNIEARYESYKQELYKKSTKEFTAGWFRKIKEIIIWLDKLY